MSGTKRTSTPSCCSWAIHNAGAPAMWLFGLRYSHFARRAIIRPVVCFFWTAVSSLGPSCFHLGSPVVIGTIATVLSWALGLELVRAWVVNAMVSGKQGGGGEIEGLDIPEKHFWVGVAMLVLLLSRYEMCEAVPAERRACGGGWGQDWTVNGEKRVVVTYDIVNHPMEPVAVDNIEQVTTPLVCWTVNGAMSYLHCFPPSVNDTSLQEQLLCEHCLFLSLSNSLVNGRPINRFCATHWLPQVFPISKTLENCQHYFSPFIWWVPREMFLFVMA